MKLFFRQAAQTSAQTLDHLLSAGHYEAAATALNGCRPARQRSILESFARSGRGHIIARQQPGYISGSSFIEYLADQNDRKLMAALVKSDADQFAMPNSDALKWLHTKNPKMLSFVLSLAPWLERDFEDAMSFERFLVQAEIEGRCTLDLPVTEDIVAATSRTWLPRRDIRAFMPEID